MEEHKHKKERVTGEKKEYAKLIDLSLREKSELDL